MAGQVSQNESWALANHIGGLTAPFLADGTSNLPAADDIVPGQVGIDYSTTPPTEYYWDGGQDEWVAGPETLYIALLTGDPSQASLSSPGTYAQTVADIASVEDTTAGYARMSVTFGQVAGSTYPDYIANTNALTFGPYTANQAAPVQWAALVTSQTGTTGNLKYTWTLTESQQVEVSQTIQAGVGSLVLGVS